MLLFSILLSEVGCPEKSKCKQNSLFCDKVIVCLMLLRSRNPKKSTKESQALTSQTPFTFYPTTDDTDEHRFLTSVINV